MSIDADGYPRLMAVKPKSMMAGGGPSPARSNMRDPIPTWFFVLVVVRHEGRFLIVHERRHGQLWYLPAGRVEPGEDLLSAARRETLEESGIAVTIDGVIRVEHSPLPAGARLRVILSAVPTGEVALKCAPDSESLGAAWAALDELARYPLRGAEVERILSHVAGGGAIYPLTLLTAEGAPFPRY
jgi:8-oxo-dGTP pyrophosphatase MutT (NUDIX family)